MCLPASDKDSVELGVKVTCGRSLYPIENPPTFPLILPVAEISTDCTDPEVVKFAPVIVPVAEIVDALIVDAEMFPLYEGRYAATLELVYCVGNPEASATFPNK